MKELFSDELVRKILPREEQPAEDLVPLALTPLMGGEMEQKDRILESLDILRRAEEGFGDQNCVNKLEAVIYTMAEKFLEQVDMEDVRKGVAMTRLGQMLIEEGRAEEIIETGMEYGVPDEDILNRLQRKLDISLQKAQEYFEMFGKQAV